MKFIDLIHTLFDWVHLLLLPRAWSPSTSFSLESPDLFPLFLWVHVVCHLCFRHHHLTHQGFLPIHDLLILLHHLLALSVVLSASPVCLVLLRPTKVRHSLLMLSQVFV